MTLRGRVPEKPLLALPYSWPEDRAGAEAILDGTFLVRGRRQASGSAAWGDDDLPPRAAVVLHGFSWVLDLRAVGTRAAQMRARDIVGAWVEANGRWRLPAWRADVLGRRLFAWLVAADFLIDDVDDAFAPPFFRSAAEQARHLNRVAGRCRGTAGAIAVAKGRLAAALALGIGRTDRALEQLCREAGQQILPDGGPVQRSPSALLSVMRDLLDVRAALQATEQAVPEPLTAAVARAAPMLRALRLGDGRLAVFHDGKEEDERLIDAVLARSGVKGRPTEDAPQAGFQRLACGRVVVVVDAGAPPAGDDAHAGTLSFEMSSGADRLIVNAGCFHGDDPDWRRAMKQPGAHSTLVVGEGREGDRPAKVTAQRREADGAVWLDTGHDGYRRRHGLMHLRRFYLDATGDDFRGEDELDGRGRASFQVRFHLHPQVQASLIQDGRAVLLKTASGEGWRFLLAGGSLTLEDGVYLGASDMPRRTSQIVVSGACNREGARVRWALRRETGK